VLTHSEARRARTVVAEPWRNGRLPPVRKLGNTLSVDPRDEAELLSGRTIVLTKRYTYSVKNVDEILKKMIDGVAPPKFTVSYLKSIGFNSSNDRAIIPLLKDLGFLSDDGTPLPRYLAYRDPSRSKAVMAEALREAYEDVFHIREIPTPADRGAIEGLFKSRHNSTDKVAKLQTATFFALLKHADLKAKAPAPAILETPKKEQPEQKPKVEPNGSPAAAELRQLTTELHYTIQVHLPATKDIEVFNAIFRSLRENLLS
jgi:hypothetical protein